MSRRPSAQPPTILIVAKAPVPGLCKTRIAESTDATAAARFAAAALLDTLDTARATWWPIVVAMTGNLDEAIENTRIRRALHGTRVIEQRGETFAERLANAHHDADTGCGVVQVGMDTPQVTVDDYQESGKLVQAGHTVLGPADDGGWWLLGVPDATLAHSLREVPMSTPQTAEYTASALGRVSWLRTLRDMDTWSDTVALAQQLPHSHLATATEQYGGDS